MALHKGSCHCGEVAYEVELDEETLPDGVVVEGENPRPTEFGAQSFRPVNFFLGEGVRETASFASQFTERLVNGLNFGLMLALASGGRCEGLVMDVAQGTETESLRAILRRELVAHELAANACWIEVETDRGREQALTFYADPVDTDTAALVDEARHDTDLALTL